MPEKWVLMKINDLWDADTVERKSKASVYLLKITMRKEELPLIIECFVNSKISKDKS